MVSSIWNIYYYFTSSSQAEWLLRQIRALANFDGGIREVLSQGRLQNWNRYQWFICWSVIFVSEWFWLPFATSLSSGQSSFRDSTDRDSGGRGFGNVFSAAMANWRSTNEWELSWTGRVHAVHSRSGQEQSDSPRTKRVASWPILSSP